MSLSDIFGEFPGRPEHEDFRVLVDIVLHQDGLTEDRHFDFPAHLATMVDPESLEHMATQRALRVLAGIGRNPANNPTLLAALAGMYLDAFMVGCQFERRRSD